MSGEEIGLNLFKKLKQSIGGSPPVRNSVFFVSRHLSESLSMPFRHKNRIIAKAIGAVRSGGYRTIDNTINLIFAAILNQDDCRAEPRPTVGNALKLSQQQSRIGCGIVPFAFAVGHSIPCGKHARTAVKCSHFQTCIVGETVAIEPLTHPASLQQRIPLKRVGCLGNIVMTTDIAQRQHRTGSAQNISNLAKLVRIIRCENQWLMHIQLITL